MDDYMQAVDRQELLEVLVRLSMRSTPTPAAAGTLNRPTRRR
jgi:hypothetical protein